MLAKLVYRAPSSAQARTHPPTHVHFDVQFEYLSTHWWMLNSPPGLITSLTFIPAYTRYDGGSKLEQGWRNPFQMELIIVISNPGKIWSDLIHNQLFSPAMSQLLSTKTNSSGLRRPSGRRCVSPYGLPLCWGQTRFELFGSRYTMLNFLFSNFWASANYCGIIHSVKKNFGV